MPADVSDFRLIGPAPLAALRALDERSEILKGMIGWVGFRTIELPYNRTVRHAGSTKWNAAGLFNLAIESIVSFSRKPLRIFSLISFGLFVSSICYMLASLVAGSFDIHHLIVGMASFMCVGVAMVGSTGRDTRGSEAPASLFPEAQQQGRSCVTPPFDGFDRG